MYCITLWLVLIRSDSVSGTAHPISKNGIKSYRVFRGDGND